MGGQLKDRIERLERTWTDWLPQTAQVPSMPQERVKHPSATGTESELRQPLERARQAKIS